MINSAAPNLQRLIVCFACLLTLLTGSTSWAQRDLTDIPPPDPELERKSFKVAEGFEVNLYAADPQIAKPIQMNFDPQGRLWIASSEIYPHIKPGETANDKILIVEDKDGDGVADKTTVFADGLLIPTAVMPGDGGAYVGNSTELLHLKDTDGDGKADVRKTELAGFGTEDTHHILHTLRWGPGGHLYFNQSIYIHSHIETPYGVRRLNGGGIWKYRPAAMDLEVVMRGMVNSWGHHFDRWGQSFCTDGAYGEGINYTFPGAAFVTAVGMDRILKGLNPGSPKHCGLEILSGRHLPEDWQGNMITNDFRGHRVCRFVVTENESGYVSREQVELIKTDHVAFRPIDVKMGPDGAIYIADWYNPIIQHGEVDFRDPRRDHTHGRIWRVTYKGKPTLPRPNLVGATNQELLDFLKAPEEWTRQNAKNVLRERGREKVEDDLKTWLKNLDPQDPQYEHNRLEGLWVAECIASPQPELLKECLQAKDGRARAAAVRVAREWRDKLPGTYALIAPLANDKHPRVRLEAVRALSAYDQPTVLTDAYQALDHPVDEFLDYALWLTTRETKAIWLPQVLAGKSDLQKDPRKLTFALTAINSPEVTPVITKLIQSGEMPDSQLQSSLNLMAKFGNANDLEQLFAQALNPKTKPAQQAAILRSLAQAYQTRNVRPAGYIDELQHLFGSKQLAVRQAAIDCAGLWKIESLQTPIRELAASDQTQVELRKASLFALARLGGNENRVMLLKLSETDPSIDLRIAAIAALAEVNVKQAAIQAVNLMSSVETPSQLSAVANIFLQRKGGAGILVNALKGKTISKDTAIQLSRLVQSSGRSNPNLDKAIAAAGGLSSSGAPQPVKLSPAEMAQLIQEVRTKGNPQRGEAIFRREDLSCLKCHSIGGAGGKVGPDIISLGGSSQPDYIVDSLLDPNKAVKENYNAVTVVTVQGKVHSGVLVRRTDTQLVLRDANDNLMNVPLDQIDEEVPAASLMPVGLLDKLTRQELVDLVRFLSELGKTDAYTIGKERVVRRWRVMKNTPAAMNAIRRTRHATAATENPAFVWEPAYSRVDGDLPVNHLDEIGRLHVSKRARGAAFLRCELEATTPGKAILKFNSIDGLKLWIGEKPVALQPETEVELSKGINQLTFALELLPERDVLRLEVKDAPDSPAQVQIISGK
ncbi:PVC-type heme-binding CxxCH protein [Gimesia panareensis]|uniref:PVC-type heme-binding CxxCH protein n=1 Tax=Gimesia panareensis TaxID=2527978 RepID=UPI00118B5B66|nr:PVC-type heme-binding CxxCH protein [Gimesia panareensis]QDU51443.1 HEAT repeat protein [Gimesia panareensis]